MVDWRVMIVLDTFNTYQEVLEHLDMAKKSYAIIKQKYVERIYMVEQADDLIYVVELKLIEDERDEV